MNDLRFGNAMAALSFALWGMLPLYYQFLPNAAMDELLAFRIMASVPFAALMVIFLQKKTIRLKTIIADKRSFKMAFVASCLMCVSWTAFTWAMTNDRVMDASLGFFISPLTMAALGVFLLGERLSLGKKIALLLAGTGLLYQVMQYGQVPYIALSMAVFFTLYGYFKKKINYDWATCLFVEVLVLTPFALAYLIFKQATVGAVSLESGWQTLMLYIGSGPVTLAPLIFYSMAIRLTTMSNVALMQYIEPSLQFLLAVFVFGELFDEVKLVSFSLIWAGLLFTIIESFGKRRPLAKP
ncbi:EamA family transporter RarD [Vibrio ponticus]|nr:EamA family transporter RarD [Vibrio ponticus]